MQYDIFIEILIYSVYIIMQNYTRHMIYAICI